MKASEVETLRLAEFPNLLWVLVHTDEGVTGLGEDRVSFEHPDGVLRSVPAGWTDIVPADPYPSLGQGLSLAPLATIDAIMTGGLVTTERAHVLRMLRLLHSDPRRPGDVHRRMSLRQQHRAGGESNDALGRAPHHPLEDPAVAVIAG